MKAGFYPKLAISGIRKNKKLCIPYLLTCTGMIMMYYIILFIKYSDAIQYIRGSETVTTMMGFGAGVVAVFAAIFLFYTNSFLMRRRKKEFGLYNILGMNKWNISRIIFWESVIEAVISMAAGLTIGILLSKTAELGLVNIIKADINYSFYVSPDAILMTVLVFGVIFFALFLNNVFQIRRTNTIALLNSESFGEKPPKSNWVLGIGGVIVLIAAYYIAVTIKDPIEALVWFFVAVIMVIAGTYLLLIAGSVLMCRILQKNKKYYYKENHFVSVSSMVYRMKRNGAGLASICILVTMVLVMISTTSSLYFGVEDTLNKRYPGDINLCIRLNSDDNLDNENISAIRNDINNICKSYNIVPATVNDYRQIQFKGIIEGEKLDTYIYKMSDEERINKDVYQINLIPLEEYNSITGGNETLEDKEIIINTNNCRYTADSLSVNGETVYKVKKYTDLFIKDSDTLISTEPQIFIVVNDVKSAVREFIGELREDGYAPARALWTYEFDTGVNTDVQLELEAAVRDYMTEATGVNSHGIYWVTINGRAENSIDFYYSNGCFFFLGIILSAVFILAAVLIIYYKQISEGYEDQARFSIMQKVGMTKKEIRKSINSQLIIVFFIPIIGAGVHLAFAFPMIRKLLFLFSLDNVGLFALTTLISFIIFALFYVLVYRITSNAYYNIVSGAKE